MLNRRQFLESGALAAASASIGVSLSGCSAAGASSPGGSRLDQLRSTIEGRVIAPSDYGYSIASQPWNARFADVLPAAVVVVAGANDVAQTIKFAREYGLSFAVRNGRHSFAGFSANAGLIVDVSRLVDVRADRTRERATFGAGLTNLPLYAALWPTRMTVPAGTCPTVGLSGLSQAGGFGRLSRLYGLTCDNVLEVKLVTAAGDVVTANDRENADLLWACKGGGGGNFGAIVELTARLHPVDMPFTEIAYTFPLASAVRVMTAVQDWVAALPPQGHCWTEIDTGAPRDGAKIVVEFTFAGSEQRARALAQELLGAVGVKPSATSVVTLPYLSTMRDWICGGLRPDECAYTGVSPHGIIPRPAFYAKSDLIRQTWPAQAFEALVDAIARRQADRMLTPADFQGATDIGKIAFESAGGAVARPSPTAAAFAHRDIRYVVQYQSRWRPGSSESVANANIAWTQATYDSVRPWLSGSAYQGYADPKLSDWQHQYYGSNFSRLRAIKRKYDPDNVFRYAQSIPPA
ncbi:MAG TPA: FAD-dependent oxidoreductase [Candidatus Baltobacteraceae bacterium]|nr:FAD-dependent oxidoreductase [Candidatus Baltobacteraceae bacterium]